MRLLSQQTPPNAVDPKYLEQCYGTLAFNNDIATPEFGVRNGYVTALRNIQTG